MIKREPHTAFHEWAAVILQPLCREHDHEVAKMYNENIQMRSELARVSQLLQGYLDREKQLVQMLEELTDAHAGLVGTIHAHAQQTAGQAHAITQGVKQGRNQFTDPITSTEAELRRIDGILAHAPVAPPSAEQMAEIMPRAFPGTRPMTPAMTPRQSAMPSSISSVVLTQTTPRQTTPRQQGMPFVGGFASPAPTMSAFSSPAPLPTTYRTPTMGAAPQFMQRQV